MVRERGLARGSSMRSDVEKALADDLRRISQEIASPRARSLARGASFRNELGAIATSEEAAGLGLGLSQVPSPCSRGITPSALGLGEVPCSRGSRALVRGSSWRDELRAEGLLEAEQEEEQEEGRGH